MFDDPCTILIIGHRETGKTTFAKNIHGEVEVYDNAGMLRVCRTVKFKEICLKNKEEGKKTVIIVQSAYDINDEVWPILDYIVIMDDYKCTEDYIRHRYDVLKLPVNFMRKGIYNCITKEFTPL